VLTNETVFELRSLPPSIAVVGAGPLGLELAQAFARLGVDTEVFEQSDHLAGLHETEIAQELRSILGAEFPIRYVRPAEFGAAGTAGAAPVVLGAAGAGRTEGLPCISEAEPPCAWAKAAAKIAAHTIKATDVFRISCFPFFTCSLTP
jgi:hypothetical protein